MATACLFAPEVLRGALDDFAAFRLQDDVRVLVAFVALLAQDFSQCVWCHRRVRGYHVAVQPSAICTLQDDKGVLGYLHIPFWRPSEDECLRRDDAEHDRKFLSFAMFIHRIEGKLLLTLVVGILSADTRQMIPALRVRSVGHRLCFKRFQEQDWWKIWGIAAELLVRELRRFLPRIPVRL